MTTINIAICPFMRNIKTTICLPIVVHNYNTDTLIQNKILIK